MAQANIDEFLSWFGTSMDEVNDKLSHKIVGQTESRIETWTLYRGFDHLPKLQSGKYIFSTQNSEQNFLWFTHQMISRSIDPLEYAISHGKYLLTYLLNVTKHFQTVTYDNSNEKYETTPPDIIGLSNPTENCSFYMGYELPDGWFFSYKTEKFIICSKPIVVSPDQISYSP